MRAILAAALSPPRGPLDPVHRAIDRAAALILQALLLAPRCCRTPAVAAPPLAGSDPNTVSLPLAVPFLQSVSFLICLIFGVQSRRKSTNLCIVLKVTSVRAGCRQVIDVSGDCSREPLGRL